MIDDTDKDKDYNPDDDLKAEFVVEDQEIEDGTLLKWKNMCLHLILMNQYMEAFAKIVRWGKDDVAREYKKLIKFVKLMVEKLGAYSPIKAVDMDAVFDTIVDPQCIACR